MLISLIERLRPEPIKGPDMGVALSKEAILPWGVSPKGHVLEQY